MLTFPNQYIHQQNYSQPAAGSPPVSASPFAFAPPPLSSLPGPGSSRPPMPLHHSEPIPSQQYAYYPQKPGVQHHNSYPYTASLSMGYRSYSNDAQKLSPQQSSMTRTPSFTTSTGHQQQQQSGIPSQPTSPYAQRQYSGEESPQRQNLYSQLYYSQPSAADMPRSVSYHSEYAQAYPSYSPSLLSAPPPMTRHNTTSVIGDGLAGMDLSRQGPSLGYSFANRLPLVDRPFKCDECVQSFVSAVAGLCFHA